jgi:hypothetical protein
MTIPGNASWFEFEKQPSGKTLTNEFRHTTVLNGMMRLFCATNYSFQVFFLRTNRLLNKR